MNLKKAPNPPNAYEEFLLNVEKPARYIGGEWGEIKKDPTQIAASLCLAFPEVYEIGMSHLGFRILYAAVNSRQNLAAERCFAPWPDMERELRARKVPLVSLETQKPLNQFDALGFSFQHELCATNFLNMLELSGVPILAENRGPNVPFIIGGGPACVNPEPLADFVDLFLIGEAETAIIEILEGISALKKQNLSRIEILRKLSRIKGVYAPTLYETIIDPQNGLIVVEKPLFPEASAEIERATIEDLDAHPFPALGPAPNIEVAFDRLSIEVMRGCDSGCRFCMAGFIYRPARPRSPQSVAESLINGLRFAGFDEASFTSLSTSDYPYLKEVLTACAAPLAREGVSLSVSSLKAYGLEDSEFASLSEGRATGLTFAPEAGTERLRRVINKNIAEADILSSFKSVFSKKWRKAKLYFMIGLPTETDEDIAAIIEMTKRALDTARAERGGKIGITASVSSFVPKPHTPFQWSAMNPPEEIERKQKLLLASRPPRAVSVKWHNRHISFIEGVFSRGDRSLGKALLRAFQLGARFDNWDEHFKLDLWLQAFSESGIDPLKYIGEIPIGSKLPWSHIKAGAEERFLKKEWEKALKAEPTEPCDAFSEGETRCLNCGAACKPKLRKELFALQKERAKEGVKIELAPLPAPTEPAARKIRFTYAKYGAAKYLGHLDTIKAIHRIFRRAGVKVALTQGFHPQPEMTYAPPLKLGIESAGEKLDASILTEAGEEFILNLLNDQAIEGIRFLRARSLAKGAPSIANATHSAAYALFFNAGEEEQKALDELWQKIQENLPLIVRDARGRDIDLTPLLPSLREVEREGLQCEPVSYAKEYNRAYMFDIAFTQGPQPSPLEVANILFPSEIIGAKKLIRLSLNERE